MRLAQVSRASLSSGCAARYAAPTACASSAGAAPVGRRPVGDGGRGAGRPRRERDRSGGASQGQGGSAEQHAGDRGGGGDDAHGDGAGPPGELDRARDEAPVVGPLEADVGVGQHALGDAQRGELVLGDHVEGDGRLGGDVVAVEQRVVGKGARARDAHAGLGQAEGQLQNGHAAS